MIKKTLYFGNPAYLSLRSSQLVIKLPEVENNHSLPDVFKQQTKVTKPIEDIGVVVLDNKQITITSGLLEALLENNSALRISSFFTARNLCNRIRKDSNLNCFENKKPRQ